MAFYHSATRLDRVQRQMLRYVLRPQRHPGEDYDCFCRRAAKSVASVQDIFLSWSVRWARSICFWTAHVLRNTGGWSWASRVLDVRSSHELDSLRSLNGTGRPGTRLFGGFGNRRWTDSISHAYAYLKKHFFIPRQLTEQLDDLHVADETIGISQNFLPSQVYCRL